MRKISIKLIVMKLKKRKKKILRKIKEIYFKKKERK